MIGILIVAWVLTWFDLDEKLIKGINELLGKNYSTSVYWALAFIIGAIVSIISAIF